MCGIAGAIDLTGRRDFPIGLLRRMTGAIAHRGPDDEHFHSEPGLAMGARRLSILDLEGGRQPISNETGDIWVAFNGELFDYPEIRKELISQGHRLTTSCDTEAWVHLYEDYGRNLFLKTRGQFAVSLWDRPNRILFLGRDRVGICPLYYAQEDGWLLWGSEIKAILASGLITPRPDPKAIDNFFTTFCASTSRTFFEGIQSIPPGHYIQVKEGKVKVHKYWDLEFPDAGEELKLKDPTPLIEQFESIIRQAVRRRLRADVPVVTYLSGGLDSTVILGFCAQERQKSIPTFIIGMNGSGPDERVNAIESAKYFDSPKTLVTVTSSDIVSAYPELIAAAEGPVMDTSCACLLKLANVVHEQGFKVALTGEGADEALAGYEWFKTEKIRTGIERFSGPFLSRLFVRAIQFSMRGRNLQRFPLRAIAGARVAQQPSYICMRLCRDAYYSPQMWDLLGDHSPFQDFDLTNERFNHWHPLNQSLYVGYKVMLPGLLMMAKGDRVAMNSSVETRYPFLDEEVIDFCAKLAPKYKLHGWTEKWLLRKVAEKTLPRPISRRPKTMFRAKWSQLFLGTDRPAWVDQLLSPEALRTSGFFDPKGVAKVRNYLERFPLHPLRRLTLDASLVGIIATQLWYHTFMGKPLADLPQWSSPNFPEKIG